MLTLNQFLAYCSRNDIKTVRYQQVYNYIIDNYDIHISLLTTVKRDDQVRFENWSDYMEVNESPEDFYCWYNNNLDPNFLENAVRNYMRSKCPRRAFFNDDFLPF